MPMDMKAIEEAFTTAGERLNGMDGDMDQMKDIIEGLRRQMKLYVGSVLAGTGKSADGQNFWPTRGHAKQFGDLVLCTLGLTQKKDMDGITATAGGFLVPEELSGIILEVLGRHGKYRKNATRLPMGARSVEVPKITSDLTVFCSGEGGDVDKSDIELGMVKLEAKEWECLTAVSRELTEDASEVIGEIVAASMIRSMARKEDLIGFIGDGTKLYFGMTGVLGALRKIDDDPANIAGLVVASGNAYGEITLDDFRDVVKLLPEEAEDTAKWYMSKSFYYDVVYPLAEAKGVANMFEILSDRKSKYFLGYEVVFISCMPDVEANSQICAVLGDLKMGAYLADRRAFSIEQSDHVYFTRRQKAILGSQRIDINVFGVGDTSEPGPIVGLITAAS